MSAAPEAIEVLGFGIEVDRFQGLWDSGFAEFRVEGLGIGFRVLK